MGKFRAFFRILFLIVFVFVANSFYLMQYNHWIIPVIVIVFIILNVVVGFTDTTITNHRLKFCNHGLECLMIFSLSTILSIVGQVIIFLVMPTDVLTFIVNILVSILAHTILFWNGIINVYCTSVQLGIKERVIGAICGPIPVLNIIALLKIIRIVSDEISFETQKDIVNKERKELQMCHTKYPILLVHGVFFRDSEKLNYWGRVPEELEKNGATIFYGEHQSALSVKDSAKEMATRIESIVKSSGCEKVNIIAHSKGGLDCKYAIANLGIAPYVASLTTINTPHRGCGFADYLLHKAPVSLQNKVASTYNLAAKKLGDTNPSFIDAVSDLCASKCEVLNEEMVMPEGIYYQSVGSILKKATQGKFPLNFSYHLVGYFDGSNDGLVSVNSFAFGEKYMLLSPSGNRGISHADMIDLNRENIKGFDVREFYVQLVAKLKNKGL